MNNIQQVCPVDLCMLHVCVCASRALSHQPALVPDTVC